MRIKLKLAQERADILVSFLLFMVVVSIIVFSHAYIEGYGLHFSYSISRYIGLTPWSAILFFLNSLVIAFFMYKYLRKTMLEWNMTRLWWLCSVLMLVMLVMLAACPVGLFDARWGDFGIISILHQFSSRCMFLLAVLTGIETMIKFRKAKFIRFFSLFFVLYGAIFAILTTVGNWFVLDNMLFFEWAFLAFYLIMMIGIPGFNIGNKHLDE